MKFLDEKLSAYAEEHTSKESPLLQKLTKETYENVVAPRMLSGHIQGRFLSMISHLIKPKAILEIGTYTGYSAICLAEGLHDNGILHTIDINPELEDMVQRYLADANIADKVVTHLGNALEIIPTLDCRFDLVFIDADKENYSDYYDLVFDKVNPGGVIVADNVLWSGKVLDAHYLKSDVDTWAINAFNKKITNDDRVENILLPLRDGLMVVRKK